MIISPHLFPSHLHPSLVRTKTDVSFFQSQLSESSPFTGERIPDQVISNATSDIVYNQSGDRCAVATTEGIMVYSTSREPGAPFSLVHTITIDYPTARWVSFSPQGNYLISFETYRSAVPLNLIVWDVATGESIMRLSYSEELSSAHHLPVQWSVSESHIFVLQPGSLAIYATGEYETPVYTLQQKKMSQFQVSPPGIKKLENGYNYHEYVAVFSPSYADKPARLLIYRLADLLLGKSITSVHNPTPAEIACGQYKPGSGPVVKTGPLKHVSLLSTFRATEVLMSWHTNSYALLAQTFYDDEETASDSYYGENRLFIVYVDRDPLSVTFSNKGTIHDAQWCPNGFEFVTLHGESKSAQATVWFARDCTPVKELGAGAWNTIRYSPSGRYILLAGFGSLAGRMEVWDKTKLVRIYRGQDHDSPRFVQWTPCGRFFYTATVFPWLRVGNQFKIYSTHGVVVYKETPKPEISQIHEKNEDGEVISTKQIENEGHYCQISVIPSHPSTYPDYNLPQPLFDRAKKQMTEDAEAKTAAPTTSSSSKFNGGKYIPPFLRNKDPSTLSAPTTSNNNNSHPRDLVKERKKGNAVDASIGATKVNAEKPPPRQPRQQQQQQQSIWRRGGD